MTKPYWVSYIPRDHIADTQGLTRLAKACYYDLFNACFVRGGFLPNDAAELARICGCTPEEWEAIYPELLRLFAIDGRGWHHCKLLAEMHATNEKIAARKAAGSKGGRAKAMNGKANRKPSKTYHSKIESDLH